MKITHQTETIVEGLCYTHEKTSIRSVLERKLKSKFGNIIFTETALLDVSWSGVGFTAQGNVEFSTRILSPIL